MNGGRGREADGAGDLADGWRNAGRPDHGRDVVEDLPLPFRIVLGHASSFSTVRGILPNTRSIVNGDATDRRRAEGGEVGGEGEGTPRGSAGDRPIPFGTGGERGLRR
jgi:hypothetical protein